MLLNIKAIEFESIQKSKSESQSKLKLILTFYSKNPNKYLSPNHSFSMLRK